MATLFYVVKFILKFFVKLEDATKCYYTYRQTLSLKLENGNQHVTVMYRGNLNLNWFGNVNQNVF